MPELAVTPHVRFVCGHLLTAKAELGSCESQNIGNIFLSRMFAVTVTRDLGSVLLLCCPQPLTSKLSWKSKEESGVGKAPGCRLPGGAMSEHLHQEALIAARAQHPALG